MAKKLLSVLLAVLMVISSVSCLFTANVLTASAEGENFMANIAAGDWVSGWSGETGKLVDGEIMVKAAWRSVYTKVTLSPNTKHTLSFSFGQTRVGDVRVFPASEITNPETQLKSVGSAPTQGGTTNLAADAITCSITSGTPENGKFYNASETFTTVDETEYYIILDCFQCADSNNSVLLKNLKIEKIVNDPNVLNDEVMKSLSWNAIWSSGLKNPVSKVLDKSESYSGNAYAMTWSGTSRYRDNFAVVTLEPFTTYDFSFSYKSGTAGERIAEFGFVDAANTDFSTYKGDYVKKHNTSNVVLGQVTGIQSNTDGSWNNVSTTFTTGGNTEYVMYLQVNFAGGTFSNLTLSDFSLVAKEQTPTETLLNPVAWNSTWRLQGSVVNFTSAQNGITCSKSNYRDSFNVVKLAPNTNYDLSFKYKGLSELSRVVVCSASSVDLDGYYVANSTYPDNITALTGLEEVLNNWTLKSGTYDGTTENAFSFNFTTKDDEYYYIVLSHNNNSGYTLTDISLEENNNVFENTTASDWLRGDTGAAFANNGSDISGMAAYRSFYTKVTLEPNTTYNFSFDAKFVKARDVHLYPVSLIADITTMYSGGYWKDISGDLSVGSFVTNSNPNTKYASLEEANTYFTASKTFKTSNETEYYLVIDGGNSSGANQSLGFTGDNKISMKNITLTPMPKTNNTLSDDVMAGLTWKALWDTYTNNPVAAVLDKSQSYSGKSYAMQWNKAARWRDDFTTITLEPNTTYNFSLRYKSGTLEERLDGIGFVEASKTDFSTIKGARVQKHLTDSSAPILGKTEAVIESVTDGSWNEVTTTFTTTNETEYVMFLQVNYNGGDATNFALTLSDFSLVPEEEELVTDDLTDTVATDWTSSWSGQKGTTAKAIAVKSAYRSAYTKVTVDSYNDYTLKLDASWVKINDVRVYAASEITDVNTQLRCPSGGGILPGGTNNLVESFTSTAPETNYETATEDVVSSYYNVTATFKSGAETEYYIVLDCGQFLNDSNNEYLYRTWVHLKNCSLTGVPYEVDPNVLNDTAMKKLTWIALWNSDSGDKTIDATVLDKSESYSGASYVMSWGRPSRYRDNYTVVTLAPNTTYSFSFRYKAAGVEEIVQHIGFVDASKVDLTKTAESIMSRLNDSGAEQLGRTNAVVEQATNGAWNKVSTTFTTSDATEYIFYMGIGKSIDNSFATITFSDFDLREYVDPNKLVKATVANGDVRWSVGKDAAEDYITVDDTTTYTNSEGTETTRSRVYYFDEKAPAYTYYGGYTWRIILGGSVASEYPAVFGYISAKGLAADTAYTFSYVYNDSYHVKLADIYNEQGSLDISNTITKILPDKEGSTAHYYLVTTTFTTDAEGDYTIKLQTGRSKKYYMYDASSWALTVGDLSLVEYEALEIPEIPANALENHKAENWKATWYEVTDSTDGYNGASAISITGIHYHGIYTRVDLKPNTEYTLTFNYKSRAAIDRIGIVDAANTQLANVNDLFSSAIVKDKGSIVYYHNTEKLDDTWNKVTAKFVTGDNTAYYIYLENNTGVTPNLSGATVISDMNLAEIYECNANKVDYDFENGNIGAISTTSASDKPTVAEENGNKYLKFTRVNDGITVPFYHNSDTTYVVSFDMKVFKYPTSNTLALSFRRTPENNNPLASAGGVFSYRNDAYSLVTKDMNGNILTAPAGLNYGENYQFNGYKQTFTSGNDWVHYEITLNPDYTWYTGLANFGFDAAEAGWSIGLDNIKVTALDGEFKANAFENYEPTKYAAIRQKTVDAKQGIRVKSSINASLLTANNGIKIVEYGTLAINSKKLGNNELVYEMVNSSFDAKLGVAYSEKTGENAVFEQKGDVITFTGVLIGLKDYATDYTVRGYMIAESTDGEQFVIYEDEGKTVSVYDVVYAILNDGVVNEDDTVAEQIVAQNEAKYNAWVEANIPAEEELVGSKTVNLTVSNSASPVINNYRGFSGTVYHAFGFMEDDNTGRAYDEAMRNKEIDRLADAGIHYVRTRYQSQWIFDDTTGYDWNTDRFNYFVKYCKELEKRDIEVILQVGWHFDFVSQDGTHSIQENDYFNGEGADLYGESAGVDFSGKSAEDIRIIKAARRYTYLMAKTLEYAKAKGVNNIKYFSYFVEPSNAYSSASDNILDRIEMSSGHDKEQYLLFCQTMINALKNEYKVTGVKHMGPNEASYTKLINYVLQNDPGLFDVLTAHNYPEEGDIKTNYDKYYDTMTNNSHYNVLNGYSSDFNDYKGYLATAQKANSNAEFWSDEFNIKDFEVGEGRGTSSFYRGLATAMGGIVAQQSGIQNTILWMSFDQLWTDKTGGDASTKSEFMNGIHQCGNAPSLFLSDDPYAHYYPTSLFSKYNGYKNGTVYKTNLTETEQKGVYVGAVKLEDGSWTVSVLNMNTAAVNINVAFDTAINQTLYRHIVSSDKADTYKNAELPEADKTFNNVGTTFGDVLPAGSFAVYTGLK